MLKLFTKKLYWILCLHINHFFASRMISKETKTFLLQLLSLLLSITSNVFQFKSLFCTHQYKNKSMRKFFFSSIYLVFNSFMSPTKNGEIFFQASPLECLSCGRKTRWWRSAWPFPRGPSDFFPQSSNFWKTVSEHRHQQSPGCSSC